MGELGFETQLCPSETEVGAQLRQADQAELFLNIDMPGLDMTARIAELRDRAAAPGAAASAEARQPLSPILVYSILDRGSSPARHLSGALVGLAGDGAGAESGEMTHHGT